MLKYIKMCKKGRTEMRLSQYLFTYRSNNNLTLVLNAAKSNPKSFVTIEEKEIGFKIEPTFLFYRTIASSRTSVILDKNYQIMHKDCGCLEFYKKQECIHSVALYAISLMILNPKLYDQEYEVFQSKVLALKHNQILNRLSLELKTANAYFGLIHLTPCIEAYGHNYQLSLKIGYDKEYVIKNILGFIHCMENNLEYSYGQRLSFVHSYECLDEVSKEFYSFLMNIKTDSSEKSVEIRKSHVLKILEIFQGNTIYFKAEENSKSLPRKIVKSNEVELVLNAEKLFISSPRNSSVFVSGVNNAYFIDKEFIYTYTYNSRMEGKIFECLFKVEGGLIIDVNSEDFIANLLPMIKNSIQIQDDFYERYPVPDIKICSYISYEQKNIYLTNKIECDEENRTSPYMLQLLDGYYQAMEGFYFTKNKEGRYNICNIENQYKFLTSDLSFLKSFGEIYFDESMKNIRTKKSSRTSVNISYNVGLLDFQFENNSLTLEEIQQMLNAYHQKKKFVQLKDNTILEINEADAKEIDDFLEDFNISIKDINTKIHKPLNYLLKLVEGQDKNLSLDDTILKIMENIKEYKKSDILPKSSFLKSLREYQIEGFKWLKTLSSYGFGGILADDMGLGKTLEIISFIDSDESMKPSLIVCPMSLVYNWEHECMKWGLECPVYLIIGSAEERSTMIQKINDKKKSLYITSYDSLRRDVDLYQNKFRFVIADEAQFIKNQFAQKSEAIKTIQSDINYALTGTPIENGLADLWSIFDFIMPGYLSNYSHFKNRYETLILHKDEEALENLQKRVNPFILRRTKKDVLKDLPDKIEDYYYCKMDTKQKEIYDAYVLKLKEDIKMGGNNILALLTRLRQICITPELLYQESFENTKVDMAIDLIKSSIDSKHRVLLFSQFAQSFPILSKELEKIGIKYFILDGSTKSKARLDMVEEFNTNEDIKVFIISLKAGGTGLNLVGADMVIHLDPWWNLSAETQATDRAYRIGQTKNVYVVKLICKDTIEEKVIKLQALKKELAESILESDEQVNVKFTKEDILELLD